MPRLTPRLTLTLLLPPAAITYGTHRYLTHLETLYPPLPAEKTTSRALRTPQNPDSQICRDVDIYSARVPLHSLLPAARTRTRDRDSGQFQRDLQDAWGRALINSPVLRVEGSLVGLLTRGRYDPGDVGNTAAGFSSLSGTENNDDSPRKLLSGIMAILRAPSSSPHPAGGLLISWTMSPRARKFFECLAHWGYPWRLMSGGRHEVSAILHPGEEEVVEVRFACAHDYEFVPEEGGIQKQKCIPAWTGRLHRGYARMVLDFAVWEVRRQQQP